MEIFNLSFVLAFIVLLIAVVQDLKRREVDNWLNLLIVISSLAFAFISSIFIQDYSRIVFATILLFCGFIIANLFYYLKFFAGGDAKLLFALSPIFAFASSSFFGVMDSFFLFIFLLLFCGGVYGLGFSLVLFLRNFSAVKKEFGKNYSVFFRYTFLLAILFLLLGYFHILFLFFGLILLVFPPFFILLKSVERVSLIKEISSKELREGDWLISDVKLNKNLTIKKSVHGLSLDEISLLQKLDKKVFIREGIPFVPGFLIAFLVYVFFRKRIFDFFVSLFMGSVV